MDIDSELDRLQREFAAWPDQVEAARATALRRTGAWVRTRMRRSLAKRHRMPQKAIKSRIYVSRVRPGDEQVSVWVGTWRVDPTVVGNPRQTRRGVRVGRRFYRGAFLADVYGPTEKIWIRLRSRHYDPELYPTRHRPGARGALSDPRLKHRFPVVRAAIDISDDVDEFARVYGREAEMEFIKKFRDALRYQTMVKGIM